MNSLPSTPAARRASRLAPRAPCAAPAWACSSQNYFDRYVARTRAKIRALAVQVSEQCRPARPPGRQATREADDGVQDLGSAVRLIAGIETMHMVRKGQLRSPKGLAFTPADQFYSLATR
jgi:hypothetical protein